MASGAPVAGVRLRLLCSHLCFLLRIKAPGLSLPQGQTCAVLFPLPAIPFPQYSFQLINSHLHISVSPLLMTPGSGSDSLLSSLPPPVPSAALASVCAAALISGRTCCTSASCCTLSAAGPQFPAYVPSLSAGQARSRSFTSG